MFNKMTLQLRSAFDHESSCLKKLNKEVFEGFFEEAVELTIRREAGTVFNINDVSAASIISFSRNCDL